MIKSIKSDNDRIMTFDEHIKSKALKINEQMCLTISEPDNEIACSMELALRRRVMSLRDNPQFSDLEIITPSKSYHAHKLVLSARSSDWGKGQDLSSAVLDWRPFSEETCEDIIDYLYTDKVGCLDDKLYDDIRIIKLLGAASFFSLSELMERCERVLEESKERFPIPMDSPAVLMKVALQASEKNLKKSNKRSVLKINNQTKSKSKKGVLEDSMHDHNYLGLNIQRKKSFKKKRLKKIALDTGENTDDDEENESAGQVQATCDAPRRTNFDKFKLHTEDELFPPNPVSFVQRCFGSDVKEYYQLITDTKSYYDRLPQMPVTVSDTVLNSVTQKYEHGHFVLKASDEVNSKMEVLRSKQKLGLSESFLTTELPRTSNFEEELQKKNAAAIANCDIAIIGPAVMGQNLILNMNNHGFKVCTYNRTTEKVDEFIKNMAKGTEVVGANSLQEMVAKLKKPRRVMILVKAGAAVDSFMEELVPFLEKGDIIIDGGNSEYQDTVRRLKDLEYKGILYVDSSVSGGNEGARYRPSLMPGSNPEAFAAIKPIFQAICAKIEEDPCSNLEGGVGSGHFIKNINNCTESEDKRLMHMAFDLMQVSFRLFLVEKHHFRHSLIKFFFVRILLAAP